MTQGRAAGRSGAAPAGFVLACACLGAALCFFSATAVNVLLPAMAEDLQAGPESAQWVVQSYWMATASLTLVFGRLSDLWGRRRMFCSGLLVFATASAVAVFSPDAATLSTLRAVQGIAAAAIFATTAPLVTHAHGGPRLGPALGHLATVAALAQAGGPALGALIGQWWGWRAAFALIAAAALALLLAARHLSEDRPPPVAAGTGLLQAVDLWGALWASATLLALCWGLMRAGRDGGGREAWFFLLAAAAAGGGLWHRLQHAAVPLIAPGLLRDARSWGVYAGSFAVGMAQQGPLVVLAIHGQVAQGRSMVQMGAQLSSLAIGMLVGAPCAGRLARRWAPTRVCLGALATMQLALLGLLLSLSIGRESATMAALWLLGVGIALFVTPSNQVLMQHCPARHRGVVNALRSTIQHAGILAGIAWLLVASGTGKPEPPAHPGAGVQHAFGSLVIVLAAAQGMAWWWWRTAAPDHRSRPVD